MFEKIVLKEAVPEVSKVRFEQTLCAEFPQYPAALHRLEHEKTEQTPETLAKIWSMTRDDALALAEKLVDVGFFEPSRTKEQPSFWIPFLYRDALSRVQGAAE